MCHGRSDAIAFAINILLRQCCVLYKYNMCNSGKFLNKKCCGERKEIWRFYVLTEDRSDIVACMETSPRNSLSPLLISGYVQSLITGQLASKTAPINER